MQKIVGIRYLFDFGNSLSILFIDDLGEGNYDKH